MQTLLAAGLLALGTTPCDQSWPCSPDLSGRWIGCWVSDKNGHHGPLRAQITKVSDDCYRIRFAGRFWKVIPFLYAVTLRVVEVRSDGTVLSGGRYLGPLLGTFQCKALVTDCRFDALFTSKGDWGRFHLSRPGPSKGR